MNRHSLINKLKRTLPTLGVPIHELPGTATAPPNCRWPGLWLGPEGVYFIRRYGASVGRIAHEAGHWALCPPELRSRLTHQCLIDQDIDTLGTDMAAEAWAGAAGMAAGIGIEQLFTDMEDYKIGVGMVYDEYTLGLTIGTKLIEQTHAGVMILRLLDMCDRGYPVMLRWVAGEDQVYLWAEFEKEVRSHAEETQKVKPMTLPILRTPSGAIDGSAMLAAGRGAELLEEAPTAGMVKTLNYYAKRLMEDGDPASTPRAIALLSPYQEGD